MTTTQQFLAHYHDSNGPITAIFSATDAQEARAIADASGWVDEARTDLEDATGRDLSAAAEDDVREVIDGAGWVMVSPGATSGHFDLYSR